MDVLIRRFLFECKRINNFNELDKFTKVEYSEIIEELMDKAMEMKKEKTGDSQLTKLSKKVIKEKLNKEEFQYLSC
jgi:hypothetical protein